MTTSADHTADTVERLRLATSLVHTVPEVALELTVGRGPHLVVSHDAGLAPDVSPCELRRLVAELAADDRMALGLGWLRDLARIDVGGRGVRCADGVVAVDRPDALVTAFATRLDDRGVVTAAREVGAELVAKDPCAVVVLRNVHPRVHHDVVLGASRVTIHWPPAEAEEAQLITAAVARRCWVDELMHASPATRT